MVDILLLRTSPHLTTLYYDFTSQTTRAHLQKDMLMAAQTEQLTLLPTRTSEGQNEPFTLSSFDTTDWSSGIKLLNPSGFFTYRQV
jgi:hypothetical protein